MSKLVTFASIMLFYIFLSYVLFPALFFYVIQQKSFDSAGNGYIVGSLISIGLWQFFGKNIVEKAEG